MNNEKCPHDGGATWCPKCRPARQVYGPEQAIGCDVPHLGHRDPPEVPEGFDALTWALTRGCATVPAPLDEDKAPCPPGYDARTHELTRCAAIAVPQSDLDRAGKVAGLLDEERARARAEVECLREMLGAHGEAWVEFEHTPDEGLHSSALAVREEWRAAAREVGWSSPAEVESLRAQLADSERKLLGPSDIRDQLREVCEERNRCRDGQKALTEQRDAARGALRKCVEAVGRLIRGYPGYEWKGCLHEEGCPGVHFAPGDRDEERPCKCDGDEDAAFVESALSAAKEAMGEPAAPNQEGR